MAIGQQVASLVNGARDEGMHEETWDGRNDAGRRLASGVYLCLLSAGDFRTAQRMVLIK